MYYLHETCKKCKEHKDKKCKGYQFLDTLKTVGLNCKKHKAISEK